MSTNEAGQIKNQLALAVQLNDEATFSDFCWTGNELLQQQMLPVSSEHSERLLYLWGAVGSGKSHLLQAYCQAVSQTNQSARYVPLTVFQYWDPAVLEGMEDHAFIAIDDVDTIAGRPEWEEALFHLYNRIVDRQTMLIIAGETSPASMTIQLPDLRSRLASGLVLQVHELSDENKITTLQAHAQKRGFELPMLVGHYIVSRCARNMHDLHAVLDKLDHASLVAQRKITIPFVKDILGV